MNDGPRDDIPPDQLQKSAYERSRDPKYAHLLENKASIWVNKDGGFPVTANVRLDRAKWVREWDKGVEKLSKSGTNVFLKMADEKEGGPFLHRILARPDHEYLRNMRFRANHNHRTISHQIRSSLGNPALARCLPREWFTIITPEERRDVLNKGIEDACWSSWLGQDSRVLCPEVTATLLLRQKGLALFNFFDRYTEMALASEQDPSKKDMV